MRSLLALILLLGQAPRAQQTSASIEGGVVKLGTSEPIARARVVITKADVQSNSQTFTTDGTGKFVFRNLQPGRYRLFATRDGYVRGEYGQKSGNRQGTPIALGDLQEMKDVALGLTPTGAIAGRVYDRYGDPVVNANVQALKYSHGTGDGRRTLTVIQSARTNDLGEYRLYWMQPGRYIVSAVPQEGPRFDGGSVLVDLGPGSPIMINGGTPGGVIRIGGAVAAASGVVPGGGTAYLPVYFPGTTDPTAAAPIDLPAGINFAGVDLLVVETRTVRVRGRLVSASGEMPSGSQVMLVTRQGPVLGGVSQRNTNVTADGSFDFQNIAPGSYDLVAIVNEKSTVRNLPDGTVQVSPGTGVAGRLTARVPIEVGNADVDNLTVVVRPGVGVPGRLVIEGLQPGNYPGNTRVGLRFDPPTSGPNFPPGAGVVGTDGTFALTGVAAGTYRITVSNMPAKSYIKSARLGGQEVLNAGVRIEGPPQGELEIIVGMNSGVFDAIVQGEKQEPAVNVQVVLVPDSARRQRSEAYRTAFTDASGRVHLEGIAPGDYKAFAWEDVEAGAWQDPDFIRTYEDRGRPVRIPESGAATTELRLIKSQ
ncbi:MAG: carboxypeptidase regulatory-like domain-containing protein [Acidobacteria bacterium]|nr:carboxypeptidase regulatory-like domain-containing protein [Acidobacteriota bacterium]